MALAERLSLDDRTGRRMQRLRVRYGEQRLDPWLPLPGTLDLYTLRFALPA